MPLTKTSINIPLGVGVDTKTDKFQVQPGKMLNLENAIFQTGGLLQKRSGNQELTAIGSSDITTLTTFSGSLTAIGTSLKNYSPENTTWYDKGSIAPCNLSVLPIVRRATSQSRQDVAIASNGFVCAVWADSDTSSYYQILDGESGNIIVAATALPATATVARVFVLGRYFIITYLATVSAATHLQYIAIPIITPNNPGTATDLATNVAALTSGYNGVVSNNNLYFAWSSTGPNVRFSFLDRTLVQHSTTTIASRTATKISVTADNTGSTPTIWLTYWDTTNNNLYAASFSASGNAILASTVVANSAAIIQVTAAAADGVLNCYYEKTATYGYSSAVTNFITTRTITSTGSLGTATVLLRGVALASKVFWLNGAQYVMVVYGSSNAANQDFQPTYFLVDSSGNIVAKLANSNSGGYPTNQVLPQGNVDGSTVKIGYLFKDLVTPVTKGTTDSTSGIYAQTGINLATFDITVSPMVNVETAQSLHLAGGFVWQYDGEKPVEHGFHVWPEDILATWSATGGSIVAKPNSLTNTNAYFYQVTYEWTDAGGNIHRSAPSVPIAVTTSGSASTGSITLDIPTLRLTYKTVNKVRIVIYRWSLGQQEYHQVTSVSSPLLNNPTVDSVQYVDTVADATIAGNLLIYTTGGVVENIAAPACGDLALYKTRVFLPDSEDENLIWYSKQTIEATPVEFSDLFTLYLAPTIGSQGSTGKVKIVAPMDDKNIFFKPNAIYYNTGTGPDNTGNNNDFSEPQFITATVGCDNPQSIVFQPSGLMFQSDKGIWLLGRDLSTSYIGAEVEAYNGSKVLSSISVPGTNQVRFTLDNGVVLEYDYYYKQWGVFKNVPAVSSTLYQDLPTYINSSGKVFQENPGSFLDGSSPVLMSLTTGWMNFAGLQGYERLYQIYLLGQYYTPFKLNVQICYDYNPNPRQSIIVTPNPPPAKYGSQSGPYGSGTPYGGDANVFEARIFPQIQKCESFQLIITEIYDPQYGVQAGAGLTLSGINLVVGVKKGYRTSTAARSFG